MDEMGIRTLFYKNVVKPFLLSPLAGESALISVLMILFCFKMQRASRLGFLIFDI